MKIVFLDVDNVLNSKAWFRRHPTPRRFSVDPECCKRVVKICKESKAALIVSSSWRLKMKPRHLVECLSAGGITKELVLGFTPHLLPLVFAANWEELEEPPRGLEITEWLRRWHKLNDSDVEKFVILDDKDDMFGLQDHLVQTNPEIGISDADVQAAISHLT
jgi:hypothetical protein